MLGDTFTSESKKKEGQYLAIYVRSCHVIIAYQKFHIFANHPAISNGNKIFSMYNLHSINVQKPDI